MKQVSLFLLLLTILNISCKSLAAKDRCKICREFVESFNKVRSPVSTSVTLMVGQDVRKSEKICLVSECEPYSL